MISTMAPLHEEHAALLPHIDQLRAAGDAVGAVDSVELLTAIDDALSFLEHHLIPHATAEDEVLYPLVAATMGAPEATATMRRDHVEVVTLSNELRDLRARLGSDLPVAESLARDLRRVLYGLHTLVRVHFAKEEEIYVPLLEQHVDPSEAAELFARMGEIAHPHT
jgi:iron-sulfur cluster repair protein YtfE (RIC family)